MIAADGIVKRKIVLENYNGGYRIRDQDMKDFAKVYARKLDSHTLLCTSVGYPGQSDYHVDFPFGIVSFEEEKRREGETLARLQKEARKLAKEISEKGGLPLEDNTLDVVVQRAELED